MLWLLYRPGSTQRPHVPHARPGVGNWGGLRVRQGSTGPPPPQIVPNSSFLNTLFYSVIYNSVVFTISTVRKDDRNRNQTHVLRTVVKIKHVSLEKVSLQKIHSSKKSAGGSMIVVSGMIHESCERNDPREL